MTRTQVHDDLLHELQRIQALTGSAGDLNDATCPLADLAQFDSMLALEITAVLEIKYGRDLGLQLFKDIDTKHERTIGESVDYVCSLLKIGANSDGR